MEIIFWIFVSLIVIPCILSLVIISIVALYVRLYRFTRDCIEVYVRYDGDWAAKKATESVLRYIDDYYPVFSGKTTPNRDEK
jgi:hypothetical protein